ncbi:MAG: hypothetical protein ACM31D_15105 [Bacteroidota bacterium]
MKAMTTLAAALALTIAAHSAPAHEQQAVVDGRRVQPTPDTIRKLKREHTSENEQKAGRRETGKPTPSQARPDREKGRNGVGRDEGFPKQN